MGGRCCHWRFSLLRREKNGEKKKTVPGERREGEKKGNASCETAVKWEKFSHIIIEMIRIIIVKWKQKYVKNGSDRQQSRGRTLQEICL